MIQPDHPGDNSVLASVRTNSTFCLLHGCFPGLPFTSLLGRVMYQEHSTHCVLGTVITLCPQFCGDYKAIDCYMILSLSVISNTNMLYFFLNKQVGIHS